jgi:hypothetical protein
MKGTYILALLVMLSALFFRNWVTTKPAGLGLKG